MSGYGSWTVRHHSLGTEHQVLIPLDSGEELTIHALPSEEIARLIAAAPDLLEAAKRLIDEDFDRYNGAETQAWRALEAAIAKATGEETG